MPDHLTILKAIVLFPVAMVLVGLVICMMEGSAEPGPDENCLFGLFRLGVLGTTVLGLFAAPIPLWMYFGRLSLEGAVLPGLASGIVAIFGAFFAFSYVDSTREEREEQHRREERKRRGYR